MSWFEMKSTGSRNVFAAGKIARYVGSKITRRSRRKRRSELRIKRRTPKS